MSGRNWIDLANPEARADAPASFAVCALCLDLKAASVRLAHLLLAW